MIDYLLKLLPFCLIAVVGCGVNEYQQRMDAQRARIQDLDETNAVLDEPIEMPTVHADIGKDVSPAWPFSVYLRLPKGFGTTPKETTPYYINFPFYRYAGAEHGYSLFIAAAFVAEADAKQEVLKFTPRNFRIYTRRGIEDYYAKATKNKIVLPEKFEERSEIVKPFTPYPDDLKPMRYLYHEFNDLGTKKASEHTMFRVYTFEEDGKQICIVEQRPLRVANDNFDRAMKASLRTLDIGPDAASKRKKVSTRN